MLTLLSINIEGFCSIAEEVHLQLNPSCTILIKAPNGFGKAQPLDEPVLTSKGWKNMGDLTLKDRVINPVTGRPIKILAITDRGSLPTYKITFSDGTHTRCADDHLWSVYKSGKTRYKLKTLDTKTLLEDYKVPNKSVPGTFKYKYSIPLTAPVEGMDKPLPIHPYVLGFILGDGCISGNRPTVRISTNAKDWEEVADRLRSYLPDPNMLHEGTLIGGTVKHLRIHGLGKELKSLGLIGKKSKTKFIPKEYLESSIENRKLLLAGLLDTDGTTGSKKKVSKVSGFWSKSKDLRDGVSYLVRSLGGISTKNQTNRLKYGRWTISYGCSIRMDHIPFIRKYKVEAFHGFYRRNRMVNTIRDIKYVGQEVSRCITVDSKEGLYITRDFIVTHNSSIFGALVWCLYGKNLKGVSDVNTWKQVQPKNYAGTKVEVFFQRDGEVYKVIRCLNYKKTLEDGAKGNSRLLLFQGGDQVDVKGKIKLQNKIDTTLGLTYQLFMNSIMFGQGIQRLIQESNADKKKLFEEIFDLNFLNIAKGIAQDSRDNLLDEANEVERQAKALQRDIESTKGTYFELRERERSWKNTIHRERRELRKKRSELTHKLQEEQRKVTEEIDGQLDVKVKSQQKYVLTIKEKLNSAQSLSKVPLEEFLTSILKLMEKENYESAYKKLKKVKKAFIKIRKYTKELEEANDRLYDLRQVRSRLDDVKDTCNMYAADIVRIDEKIKNLGDEKLKVLSPKYKEKLEAFKKKLRKVDEDYHNKLGELKDYEWLISDPLGNNGIKAYLFDSSLDLLNHTLDTYSQVLGFRISFEIDLDSTRKDFVTLIERNDMVVDYDELSGGEKQLVNIAMAFAMNEALTASKGINLAFLDEVFESLSSDNIEIVTSLIRHVFENKTLFLITHHDSLPLSHSKTLQVEKVNGLTSFKQL